MTKIKIITNKNITDFQNAINEIKQKIDWLESHNKNYTKQQYFLISEIKDLLESLEKIGGLNNDYI